MRAQFAAALLRYCRQEKAPDILTLLEISPWSAPWLGRLRTLGVPLVFSATMLPDPSTMKLRRVFWSLPYLLVDCLIANSVAMRDALRDDGVRGRIEVIPNGVDLTRFHPLPPPAKRELRHQLGLAPDSEVIAFVGSVASERKGASLLANAWRMLAKSRPHAHLLLVGPDQTPATPSHNEVNPHVHLPGGSDRLIRTGPVSDVERYLQAADAFVFPSRLEGLPNAVLEAMACGVPCVLTPFVGLSTELGRPGEQYLLSDRTPIALAKTLSTCLDNAILRDSLSTSARKWVEQNMDIETTLDMYAALFRDLAAKA